jgi:hypothetical protein
MRVFVQRIAPVFVLVSMVFVVVLACQAQEKEGSTHEVAFYEEISRDQDEFIQRVKPIDAVQGDKVIFPARDTAIWVLIPRGSITVVSGGSDWAQGRSFVAFKVDKDDAVLQIALEYPIEGESDQFAYSILEEKNGHWKYHFGQSPPRMIIRKR